MALESRSRRILVLGAAGLAGSSLLSRPALATPDDQRRLAFRHLHTGERLNLVYAEHGRYIPGALADINHLLRDFRTEDQHPIDPALLDLLHRLSITTGSGRAYEIISGYRSPVTNEMLRQGGHGVARRSLHMDGKAVDIRLPGIGLKELRRAAAGMAAGGVGYYPASDFIHVDTGRVRYW